MTDEQSKEPEEKKIIIDEDWKAQVQAEKETVQAEKESAHQQEETEAAPAQQEPQADAGPLPPASFSLLVTSLITQALVSLGQVPDPVDEKMEVRLDLAKHSIDMLAVLQEKTKGNLTSEEDSMVETALHQMRMLFVAVQNQAASPPPEPE